MATSVAAQLQAIKASFRGREDPVRRPFTRPSVLFDPKEAADIDLRTLLPIAISGLDVLVGLDARFGGYRDTLFSHTSLDVDREKLVPKEEEKVNKSVSSYLRLLSGYLHLPAALKTLEYLIRRYRVHVFNVDDLVLCALPYHDTHAFVRIVQLLDLGNNKWGFLEGVKSSGAPPPRKIIVQQCLRDKGVLEVLCNYASPTKEFQHSRVVVCFCTAVIIEALGAVHQLDSGTIKRVLPFVFSGLNPAMRGGRDNKAGALMVIGLMASRAALAPKLFNNLLSFVARMAQKDAEELSDAPWLRMALMTIINLVQAQSFQIIPKKALKCLIEIRDFAAVIKGLSLEFNIMKFLSIYLGTLIDYSSSDASCCFALTTIIETVPTKDFVDTIVSKVLSFFVKWSQTMNTSDLHEAGSWVKQVLIAIDRNCPSELRAAVHKFLENSKVTEEEGLDVMRTLCSIVDGSLDMPFEISDSKIWFSLEHPKAVVRLEAPSSLSVSGGLEVKDNDAQDVILSRLYDDDLSVVQAALSIDGLSGIITPQLLKAFQDVLIRCVDLLNTESSVAVQVQSLVSFATICSVSSRAERSYTNFNVTLQILSCLPSLLIPLSNENKDVRTAAMDCIEELYKLLQHLDISRVKNGNDSWTSSISAYCFDEFLGLIIGQKLLILSDANFLPSFLTSILSSSPSLLVAEDTDKRLDQQAKEMFLNFILSSGLNLSLYGKLKMLTLFKGLGNYMLQVEEAKRMFLELLERRKQYHYCIDNRSSSRLSHIEVQILCLLLEASLVALKPGCFISDYVDQLVEVLKMDGASVEDPTIVKPCVAILQNLTSLFYDSLKSETQDELFANIVFLFRNDNADIRNATREALTRINISCSTIAKFLDVVRSQGHRNASSNKMKRKKQFWFQAIVLGHDVSNKGGKTLFFLSSLLDILLLKKDIGERESLVDPLFNLLGDLSAIDWVQGLIGEDENQRDALSVIPETISEAISHVQQTTLHILQEITASILSHLPVADEVFSKFNIKLLVECARATQNVVTLNHVFWLLSSVAKVSSHWVSEYIFELFTIIGDSASKQSDSHSQHILEELISTLIPCWLAKTSNIKSLLQVFVNVLPEVPENRRLTLMVYLLRTLGEKGSLGVLIALLLHLLVAREVEASARGSHELLPASLQTEWEYIFAIQICDQYSCRIWLPSLVVMFQEIGADSELELFLSMQLVIQFVSQKLQDTELLFAVESGDDSDCLQRTLGELLEQVILQLRIIDRKQKQLCIHRIVRKQLKESMLGVLKSITRNMIPSEFFKAIGHLVAHEDGNVQKKALGLLSQTVKDRTMAQKKRRVARKAKQNFSNSNLLINENASVSLCELFSRIIQLVDEPEDSSPGPVRLAAVSSLDVLAKEFPNSTYISVTCLTVVVKHISSDNTALSSSCLRSAGALISVLGSKALSVLPRVMEQVLERTHNVSKCPTGMLKPTQAGSLEGLVTGKASILLSVLVVLEAVIENLGCFLNPYLESILDLVVLHPEYSSESDQKLKTKATLLRKLITEKIPVRLLLTAIMKLYKETLKCGETSISLAFEMLANMVSLMDKSSIGSYHAKIYEHCFLALDLRRQHPEMVKNVAMVEDNVIHAIIVLTMKLTESMFRPLFIHSLDWADFESEASDATKGSLYRKISFYKLVNRLAEQHRSLFVPYFKYLVEGCVHHLTDGEGVQTAALTRKRKKAKVGEECSDVKGVLSTEQWHLRTLILMSLYKCFLYDTGNLKFLDSSNFQVLLKPIVSQLVVEPPVLLDPSGDIPTVNAVDESLVCCLGQMAVTVGSDDIWKQLNHEVLMQTRSEKVRARILGLRVVKYLVEHLKEEYLVCLPETIPFLSELLEDLEPPVKSLSQEILRELESLSGENLRQYL